MIVTVTLNPSLDRTFSTAGFAAGEVNRAISTRLDAGGKGINVSRVLHRNGIPTTAVFPVGGPDGHTLVTALARLGVPTVPVEVSGAIRSNVTVADVSGETTKINAPGPNLDEAEQQAVLDAVGRLLDAGARVVVGAGSLPEGVEPAFLGRMARLVTGAGAAFALDTSGAPLAAAVADGGLAVIKPNDDELAELVGRELRTVGDVRDAATQILADGNSAVLVSLGANGALLVVDDECWWAGGSRLVPVSTVGAGDSTLAGWLASDGAPAPERLRTAVAWGRAAVLLPGTELPGPDQIDLTSVRVVTDPDPRLNLKEL